MSTSPYAPPRAAVVDAPSNAAGQAEAIRREHIRHEIQLKSVGSLYYLGGVMGVFGCLTTLAVLLMPTTGRAPPAPGFFIGLMLFYVVLSVGALFLGYGFRRLKPWVRIPGGILSGIGLLGIPLGTLINGWILYLMFGKKGQVVLSPDYQNIIAATPHVKYQRTVGDWIATGIVLLLLVGIIAVLVMASMR